MKQLGVFALARQGHHKQADVAKLQGELEKCFWSAEACFCDLKAQNQLRTSKLVHSLFDSSRIDTKKTD